MLGFFSSKSDHPLASSKEAKQIAAELTRLDAAKGLDEATGWFISLAGLDGFTPALRFERLQELVAASLAHTLRQSREYLTDASRTRLQQQQQWQRNFDYWQHLGAVLQRCLDDMTAGKEKPSDLTAQVLTHLLAALGMQLRWIRLRHAQVPAELWGQLGKTYLLAGQWKLADKPVTTPGAGDARSTATSEYLKALVFQGSSLDNLQPIEIVLAERLIAHFLPRFAMGATASPGCVYWVDAAQASPPARLTQLPAAAPGTRFISPGEALAEMQRLHAQIAATRSLPREIAGVEELPANSALKVLDHLIQCWSPKPPLRKAARHRIASDVHVVRGLDAVIWYVSGGGNTLDDVDIWTVEDVSQGGIGVRLPLKRNDSLQVGAVVGFQPEGVAGWHVGLIRRFTRASETQGAAGIETLTKTPRTLSVMDSGLKTDLILLDALKDDSSVRILLSPSYWETGTAFVTLLDGRPWRLHADEKIEAADDWLIGRCIAEELRD